MGANLVELTDTKGQRIANTLGVRYDGIQSGFGFLPNTYQLTDTVTGSTFHACDLWSAKAGLFTMRQRFGVSVEVT